MESCKQGDNLSQPFGTDAFDSEMVEAAFYHLHIAHGQAKGYVSVEVAASVAVSQNGSVRSHRQLLLFK
jgi:hypothetical protein